jgi:2-amino-4-hydroxy-6-hydroxymethyldihydropteridine diphosphokinase
MSIRFRLVPRAYVGLGSNLGDREATIRGALEALAAEPGIEVAAVSTLIDTEPAGVVDQPRFLNGVAALDTGLSARGLLGVLLDVERRFGRRREASVPQGPRTLDLDLLVYGTAEIDEPGLRVPHPCLHERSFVLVPLAELAPGLEVPGKGPVQTLLARLH